MSNTAIILLSIAQIMTVLGYVVTSAGTETEPWPAHASIHIMAGILWVTGLGVVNLILIWIPLLLRRRWAWWTLLVSALFLYGGYFLPGTVIRIESPIWPEVAFFTAMALVYALGLALAWDHIEPGSEKLHF